MNEDIIESPGLVRIEITADTVETAQLAVTQVCGLWLTSATPPRPVPGEGVRATVHADVYRRPEESGYPFPVCPHISD